MSAVGNSKVIAGVLLDGKATATRRLAGSLRAMVGDGHAMRQLWFRGELPSSGADVAIESADVAHA